MIFWIVFFTIWCLIPVAVIAIVRQKNKTIGTREIREKERWETILFTNTDTSKCYNMKFDDDSQHYINVVRVSRTIDDVFENRITIETANGSIFKERYSALGRARNYSITLKDG